MIVSRDNRILFPWLILIGGVDQVVGNLAPVWDSIPAQNLNQSAVQVVTLSDYVSDDSDAAADLTYSVVSNSAGSLVSTAIAGDDLTLTVAANLYGIAYIVIRATDSESAFSETTLTVNALTGVAVDENGNPIMDENGDYILVG